MAAKINWHRYGTKLRHCHSIYILRMTTTNPQQCALHVLTKYTVHIYWTDGSALRLSCADVCIVFIYVDCLKLVSVFAPDSLHGHDVLPTNVPANICFRSVIHPPEFIRL